MNLNVLASTAVVGLLCTFFGEQALNAAIKPVPMGLPEKESLQLSKILKPIPDEKWAEIAGPKISEQYEIAQGDTLYDISNRLFGEPRYWPKIWAINNPSITNPHVIFPKRRVVFTPGTGTSLPSLSEASDDDEADDSESGSPAKVSVQESATGEVPLKSDDDYFPALAKKPRSSEWKKVPPGKWATFAVEPPKWVDKTGFDTRDKITFKQSTDIDLDAVVFSERVDALGEVMGGKTESTHLSLHDLIFVKSYGNIQVGNTYAITDEPSVLQDSPDSSRRGYSYSILGKVKVLGVRDEVFIGQIVSCKTPLTRGGLLIPAPAKVKSPTLITGPTRIDASLFVDRKFSTFAIAQHKQVFIDRGTEDGIQPGMVFRAYQYTDPQTGKTMTDAQAVSFGDIVVIQVSRTFCTGIVSNSAGIMKEGIQVTLLTDMGDIRLRPGVFNKEAFEGGMKSAVPPPAAHDVDELERIEAGGSIGRQEEKDLQQLENFDESAKKEGPTLKSLNDGELPPPSADGELLPPPGDVTTPPASELPPEEKLTTPPAEGTGTPPPPSGELIPSPETQPPPAPSTEAIQEPAIIPETTAPSTPPTAPLEELPPPPPPGELIPGLGN